jgi:hypothetical protein
MAATCLDIITYALRMTRVVGIGKVPKAAEAEEGMVALQSLYDDWRTGGMFGQLKDKYLKEDDTAEEGHRYYIPAGFTLTDATSAYEDRCGNTRQPRDLALYERFDGTTHAAKLYDRTAWVDLLGLTLEDIAPLSGRNDYGFAACLATSGGFMSAFGVEPSQTVVAVARHFNSNIASKIGSTQDTRRAEYF